MNAPISLVYIILLLADIDTGHLSQKEGDTCPMTACEGKYIISIENNPMNSEFVRNWMTAHPITITPQTTRPEANRIMLAHNIRYLPVVNKNKLVGITTRRDINRAQSSDGSTLSLYELNLILGRLTVTEFMTHSPITISPDASIGEAAKLMLEHQISGLPVVEAGKLIGIITETDISVSALQGENAA
jgi:acetoin utilization protein AcuB